MVVIDGRLLAYRRGGIARYVDELTTWLPRVAPELSFTRAINRSTPPGAMRDIRVRTPAHFRFERWTLGAEFLLRRPALVHSPDFIAPSTIAIQRVVTVHDLAFLHEPDLLATNSLRYYRQLERSLRVADRVIAVSNYTAKQLIDLTEVDAGKVVMIHNGGGETRSVAEQRSPGDLLMRELGSERASRLLSDRPKILMVGTIEPRKRQRLVLDAVCRFQPGPTEKKPLVILVGQEGWSCETIVPAIQAASASGDALWLNDVSDAALAALYRVSTVLAMPSLDEGFGLPLLEAMSAGLPVIAARRGALPEVAGAAAILLDSDDPVDWSRAISGLLANEAMRRELAAMGKRRAAEFTWKRTAQLTAQVYHEVLHA